VVQHVRSLRRVDTQDDGYEDRSLAYQRTLQLVIGAQRDALVPRILRDLDLEESRLEI
jgi:hypothetical protein